MSLIVVCDASPLILLAKVNRLALIPRFAGDEVVVLQGVCDEVLSERGGPAEVGRLADFLKTVRVETFETGRFAGTQLSLTDRSSLAWALENGAQRLLVDELWLRRIARSEGLEVIGALGLLVRAAQVGDLGKAEVRDDIERLIERDGMRISLALYREILRLLT